jgi:glyoxylase-like metal-dependent hydrolase (beta-lactamase superfamily II)
MVPKWIDCVRRMQTVDGDHELCDGVKLVFLPGHTEGFQGLLVNTDAGGCLIASDCLPLYENWPGNGARFHATGIHTNLLSLFASYRRIEQMNVKYFPGHEIEVLQIKKYPEKGD